MVALALAGAHAYFLYDGYTQMVGQSEPTATVDPWAPFYLAAGYLIAVPLGMKYMANREAYDLKHAMHVYNLYTTGMTVYVVVVEHHIHRFRRSIRNDVLGDIQGIGARRQAPVVS
jgi:hypothetical protein